MLQVVTHSVAGVKIVLGKCESAGGGGSPRSRQSRLNHLIAVVAAADEAAAVFHMNVDVGTQVESVTERGEFIPHDSLGDDGVDLDGCDVMAAGSQSSCHVVSAA